MEKWTMDVIDAPHTRRELGQLAPDGLARADGAGRDLAAGACATGAVVSSRLPACEALRRGVPVAAAAALLAVLAVPLAASEWSTAMWGTGLKEASATNQLLASSAMHVNNGIAAGHVNAALDGLLYEGTSINITSVGSQNVVNTTVYGDGNHVEVEANQESSNSGDVSNDGTINVQRGALED